MKETEPVPQKLWSKSVIAQWYECTCIVASTKSKRILTTLKLDSDTGTCERKKTFFTAEKRSFLEKTGHGYSQKILSKMKVLYRTVGPSV